MRQMLAVDYEFCTGCHTCEIACQQEHGLAPDRFGIKLTQIGPDQITERKWQYEFVPVPTDRCDRCARRSGYSLKHNIYLLGCLCIGYLIQTL